MKTLKEAGIAARQLLKALGGVVFDPRASLAGGGARAITAPAAPTAVFRGRTSTVLVSLAGEAPPRVVSLRGRSASGVAALPLAVAGEAPDSARNELERILALASVDRLMELAARAGLTKEAARSIADIARRHKITPPRISAAQ